VGSFALGPRLAEQAGKLADELPRLVHAAERALDREPWVVALFGHVASPGGLRPDATTVVAGATGALTVSGEVLAAFAVISFLGVYAAAQPRVYVEALLRVVPLARRPRARAVVHEIVTQLGNWLLGRAIAIAFVAVTVSIGLWLLDVPLALALGVLAGLLAFIEYVGAVVSAIPPLALALTVSPLRAVGVALLFLGVHVIEGYVLTPMLARRMVSFPRAFTLITQVVFGAVFGFLGLTFATPMCVVIVTCIRRFYVEDVLGDAT
ncbi:MAG TPA: AI-2E family transporter, partial [Minicystis sp.]|nr:AI-2E family transporter [Minicystis sp.]